MTGRYWDGMTQDEWDRQVDLDVNDTSLSIDERIAAYHDSVDALHRQVRGD